ncbi:hypothetical protein J8N05_42765 [Streptomyces sp. BH-SS-21]|uniref:Uncharacterized protein n=1 Tax=Streptomyces liliiviolaceus TaxID=2823109 RepID=A0A940Y3H6_9ACTN|nr:hypothetical protein [Streptomyces liliiviolaceus]MBQ0854888.1 hypothetical protein [Streptomyces liliiviolaceus]
MTKDMPPARPLRSATRTAVTTGSALAVVILPLVVGALASRAVGGDPMASVNAMMTGGGQRARLSRGQLRGYRGRALTTARNAWDRSPRLTVRKPLRPLRRTLAETGGPVSE